MVGKGGGGDGSTGCRVTCLQSYSAFPLPTHAPARCEWSGDGGDGCRHPDFFTLATSANHYTSFTTFLPVSESECRYFYCALACSRVRPVGTEPSGDFQIQRCCILLPLSLFLPQIYHYLIVISADHQSINLPRIERF